MSGMFHKVLQQLANQYITEKLVKSKTFQRFAYKSVTHVRGPPRPHFR